jgi:hypothetical protein
MAGYKLNGHDLTGANGNGCAPSRHEVGYTQMQTVETVGGTILIAPPGGLRRVHTWHYENRKASQVFLLLQYLDFDASPVCMIDTYDVGRNGLQDVLLQNIVVLAEKPGFQSAGQRGMYESFQLVFTEVYPQ